MAKWPTFLKKDGDKVLFNAPGELLFFLPEKLFDLRLAFPAGDYQNVFGLLNYCLVDANGKKGKLKLLKLPTRFLTQPYKIDKIKEAKLISTSKVQDYRVFRFKKGDAVIVETRVPMDIKNVEDFINLILITGNMTNSVPYDKIQDMFMKNMDVNGNNYNVSAQMFGIIFSECCRALNDPSKPYRLSNTNDLTAYVLMSVKKVSRLISSYSAFTSENFMESITHAMMNDKKVDQPLERVMTGD